MKILFVEAYPGFRGAQRSLAALLQGLQRRRGRRSRTESPKPRPVPEVAVLCLIPGRAEQAYRRHDVPVHCLPTPPALQLFGGALLKTGSRGAFKRRLLALQGWMSYSWRLRRFLRRARPDAVHCNQARGVLLVGPAARSLGIPVIWHQRGMLDLPTRVTRVVGCIAQHLVCVSSAVRLSLPQRLQNNVCVIANGIDRPALLPNKEALRQELGIHAELDRRRLSQKTILLITASSFVPYKGLHHGIDALQRLAASQSSTGQRLLWIVLGDGDRQPAKEAYRRHLQAEIRQFGLDTQVWWAGWQEQATSWLAAADLCLLPTIAEEIWVTEDGHSTPIVCSEGFPRTVLEAMTVGTTVIASDVAAVDEQLANGESGLIVPPSNGAALAEAIGLLSRQPQQRQALANEAYKQVQRFSIEAMTDHMLEFWSERIAASDAAHRPAAADIWKQSSAPSEEDADG